MQRLVALLPPAKLHLASFHGASAPDFSEPRRHERRQYAVSSTFKGAEEDDVCRQLTEGPGDWACKLPLAISVSTNEGCKLVIDDAQKPMTLTPTDPP